MEGVALEGMHSGAKKKASEIPGKCREPRTTEEMVGPTCCRRREPAIVAGKDRKRCFLSAEHRLTVL
jgi:hypothetical protein